VGELATGSSGSVAAGADLGDARGGPTAARQFVLRHGIAVAIALGAVAVIAFAAWRVRDTYVGDAAVYLPYARNAANGHLFQFNVGEFSTGSTSPLWSLLLAIPFLLGLGLAGAKAFSAAFAVLGLLATIYAAQRLSRSWTAAAVASLFVLGTMALHAVSLYESGLTVTLVAMSLVAAQRTRARWGESGALSVRALAPLIAIWAVLPLARPDAVILVVAQAVALFAFAPIDRRRALAPLLSALALAALPALAYFGASLIDLGTFSTSSQGRSHALQEVLDKWIGPLYASSSAVREVFSSPWVFAFIPAVGGVALLARQKATRWLAAFAGVALVGYLALLTFVTPAVYDTGRYLVPLVPIASATAAVLLAHARGTRLWLPALAAALLAIGISSVLELRDYTRLARSIGITEKEVFSRDVVATLNQMAQPGDTVLSYEVQLRYFLRDDVSVLSEDGITDGKVAPYQDSRDMTGFLLHYRPRWWIADRNVTTRPFMKGSILDRTYQRFKADPRLERATVDGIRFRVVARRNRPLAVGFGGWEMLFEVGYPTSAS
jgi:hypothetical protein